MGNCKDHQPDLVQLQSRGKPSGREYWRSLEELAETPEFRKYVEREFPSQASEFNDPAGRRSFLKVMGASLALAGIGGAACTVQPTETIVPYIEQPEELVPGKALFFATAMQLGGSAIGLLARSNEGRPTKLEGNPEHPASLGATDIYAQAAILDLYDPDRSTMLTYRNEIRPWTVFVSDVRGILDNERPNRGAGIRVLTETVTSPTLGNQIKTFLEQFPAAKWHQYEPVGYNSATVGAELAFGQPASTIYRFDRAERVLSLGSDFLSCGSGNVRYARDFAARRRANASGGEMNRLYAVESTLTNTGALADHRLAVRPSEMEPFVRELASALGALGGGGAPPEGASAAPSASPHASFITALAKDLQQFRGASIVIPGDEQSPMVHALAHAINAALGNVGNSLVYTDPVEANAVNQMQSLAELVQDMNSGSVKLLMILGGNPVYNAPADLGFVEALKKVQLRAHLSMHKDETSEWCQWQIPEAHFLEAWSDARAFDGTVSIMQPLIEPLYGGKSAHEVMALLINQTRKGYEIVRDYWQSQMGGNFEQAWRRAVHNGIVPDTALQPKTVALRGDFAAQAAAQSVPTPNSSMEILFRQDPTVYDGRFANNGWLQELPKPLSKLTWDNAAYISERTARDLGLEQKIGTTGGNYFVDTVNLTYRGRTLSNLPIWIMPGQPDNTVTVHLGYGRTRAGRVGDNLGFNAYALRTSDAPWQGTGVEMRKTGEQYELAATQLHFNLLSEEAENRHIVRAATFEEYKKNPRFAQEAVEEPGHDVSMYEPWDYSKGYAWGMTIDVNTCVGCSACVVACQAENNIPVVGKGQVLRSREMHWLRVDNYFKGAVTNPQTYFMPVPCMHCELAPCEVVCPVNATVHSAEGLNDMVYNRCVGTRYCSNNCPYKVRRFNFMLYQDWNTPSLKLARNPEVTIRSRGVMEKCTYCIQRIEGAKIEAEKDGRPVRDGEILTACQASCPTEAIIFGNINDPDSRVAQLKRGEQLQLAGGIEYATAHDLSRRLRNPNQEIAEKA